MQIWRAKAIQEAQQAIIANQPQPVNNMPAEQTDIDWVTPNSGEQQNQEVAEIAPIVVDETAI